MSCRKEISQKNLDTQKENRKKIFGSKGKKVEESEGKDIKQQKKNVKSGK